MRRRQGEDGGSDAILDLVRHCLHTSCADLPGDVVQATKRQLIDTLAVSVAGRDADGVRELRELTSDCGGRPEALLWGTSTRVPTQEAARVNATMAHALDFDDTYEPAVLHPSVMTVPTALTLADSRAADDPISGRELLTSVAVGVDIAGRLARSGRPGVAGFETGWHNTSLFGYLANAMVAGRLLGLTEPQLVAACGIAYHQCAGNAQAHLEGALTKRMGAGFAAHAGVLAARLAQRGVSGATQVLEGPRGLYRQYFGDDYSRTLLLDDLGRRFVGTDVSFKPWPACRGSHTAIDAALTLVEAHRVAADEVERITIWSGPGEYTLLSTPLARKQRPESVVEAQFSIPWVVAAAVGDRGVTLEHFAEAALRRPDLLMLTARTETAVDAALSRPGGGPGAARVELVLRDGRTVRHTTASAPGTPDRPMTDAQLGAKFLGCASVAGLPRAAAERLLDCVAGLERRPDLSPLLDVLRLPAAA